MTQEHLSPERLLAALRQASLQPSLSRANFETLRDAVHLIEDQHRALAELLEPMEAILYWHDEDRVIDESWWEAARTAIQKAQKL